jgi:hypothetical protein
MKSADKYKPLKKDANIKATPLIVATKMQKSFNENIKP